MLCINQSYQTPELKYNTTSSSVRFFTNFIKKDFFEQVQLQEIQVHKA